MVFLPNPPVEDAAGGEADKSLILTREMRSLFHWNYAQRIILRISIISLSKIPVLQRGGYFFVCLPSSSSSYAGQEILNKNPYFLIDTD
jgi:hypothetical protein